MSAFVSLHEDALIGVSFQALMVGSFSDEKSSFKSQWLLRTARRSQQPTRAPRECFVRASRRHRAFQRVLVTRLTHCGVKSTFTIGSLAFLQKLRGRFLSRNRSSIIRREHLPGQQTKIIKPLPSKHAILLIRHVMHFVVHDVKFVEPMQQSIVP
jgi:hypothetical protein